MPRRSTTPGRKFWTSTSAVRASAFSACTPRSSLRSTTRDRLLRLLLRNDAGMPLRAVETWRLRSPPLGFSTLMTSAPWSASSIVASGPEIIEVRSSTRTPWSGPDIDRLSELAETTACIHFPGQCQFGSRASSARLARRFTDSSDSHATPVRSPATPAGDRATSTRELRLPPRSRRHNLTLATRNTRDFAGMGVGILDPWTLG